MLILSIGAILGVMISILIARADQIRAALRKKKVPTQLEMENEPGEVLPADPERSMLPPGKPASAATGAAPAIALTRGREKSGISTQMSNPSLGDSATGQSLSEKRWSITTRYIMGVFLFLAVLMVLFIARATIPMVVAAALLALFIDPLIGFLMQRFRMKKMLAVGLTYALVIGLLLLVPLLAIPSLVNAVNLVMSIDTQVALENLNVTIQSVVNSLQTNPAMAAFTQPILDSLSTMVAGWASSSQAGTPAFRLSADELISRFGQALGALSRFLGPTFSFLAFLFFTLLMSIQMTITADGMKNWYADLIPPGYGPELAMMMQKIRRTWVGFLRGQMTLMLIIGVVIWLGGLILGLPQALFLGVIAGILELIPNVGPTLAAVPAVVLALLFGSSHLAVSNLVFALIVIGFYILVQLVENQYIVPNIMGDAVDLPPLVVLIGTIAGAGAFGIMGALLATPVIATGNLIFRYIYRKIIEDQPASPPIEQKPGFIASIRRRLSEIRLPGSKKKGLPSSGPKTPGTMKDGSPP